MEEEVKVSQLPATTSSNDEDIAMILQNGVNKQITIAKLNEKTRQSIGCDTDTYSSSSTYLKDAIVIKDNYIWKANADISTAETWTPAHWTKISVLDLIEIANTNIEAANTKINAMPEWQQVDSW